MKVGRGGVRVGREGEGRGGGKRGNMIAGQVSKSLETKYCKK